MKKLIAIPVTVVAAGLSLAACGPTVAKAPAPASSTPSSTPATTAPAAQAAQPAPAGTAPLTGPVGTTFKVTGNNGPNGASTVFTVTLNQVQQQATLGQYETLMNGSAHVAAAEFTVTGTSGQTSNNVNNDALVVGTDQQNHPTAFDAITAGTNFNHGEFSVSPGQTVTGWVSYELAPGVSVASVQWSPGWDGPVATWTVK